MDSKQGKNEVHGYLESLHEGCDRFLRDLKAKILRKFDTFVTGSPFSLNGVGFSVYKVHSYKFGVKM